MFELFSITLRDASDIHRFPACQSIIIFGYLYIVGNSSLIGYHCKVCIRTFCSPQRGPKLQKTIQGVK